MLDLESLKAMLIWVDVTMKLRMQSDHQPDQRATLRQNE